jgi:O-antigen biosynthesis protein WbqP
MKRILDLLLSIVASIMFFVPLFLLAVLVKITSNGPALYWSDQVGRDNRIFSMPKLRTVRIDTPRPALFNQENLIDMRTEEGGHLIRPGPTGWAQLKGRGELPITHKVQLDAYYLHHQSLIFDVKVILFTVLKVIRRDGIQH